MAIALEIVIKATDIGNTEYLKDMEDDIRKRTEAWREALVKDGCGQLAVESTLRKY